MAPVAEHGYLAGEETIDRIGGIELGRAHLSPAVATWIDADGARVGLCPEHTHAPGRCAATA